MSRIINDLSACVSETGRPQLFCLFDLRSDPQALNDFLHGTNEVKETRITLRFKKKKKKKGERTVSSRPETLLICFHQLPTEELLISASSGEPSLFTEAPVSVCKHRRQPPAASPGEAPLLSLCARK